MPFLMAPPTSNSSRHQPTLSGLNLERSAAERADHWPLYQAWRADNERDAYAEWIESWADWQVFATLTYDPKRHPWCPSDREAGRDFQAWVNGIVGLAPVRVRALGAVEHHASGWPHIHAMLGWPQGAPTTTDLAAQRAALYTPWYHAHGYADIKPVGRADGAARYVAKYVTKTLQEADGPGILMAPDPLRSRSAWS